MNSFLKISLLLILTAASFVSPETVFAQDQHPYIPLAPIPGISEAGQSANLGTYIQNAYKFGIRFAGIAAVLAIIYGGFQYIGSESIGNKSQGRKIIQDAVLGLILALGSFVIIYTLEPKILNTTVNIAGTNSPPSSAVTTVSGPSVFYIKKSSSEGSFPMGPYDDPKKCDEARDRLLAEYKDNKEVRISQCMSINLTKPF